MFEMKEGEIMIFLDPKSLVSKKTGQPFDAYTGKAKFMGVELDVFCFKNEKEGKKPYLKGTLKPMQPSQPMPTAALHDAKPKPQASDDILSIPF